MEDRDKRQLFFENVLKLGRKYIDSAFIKEKENPCDNGWNAYMLSHDPINCVKKAYSIGFLQGISKLIRECDLNINEIEKIILKEE